MMRGVVVLFVAAGAMIFLKRKQYIHHYVSLAILVIGVALVGLASIIFPSGDDDSDS